MPNLAKCPVHIACVDAGIFFLRRDGQVSHAQILKRAQASHFKFAISWDWVQEKLQGLFGPLLGVSSNLFDIGRDGKDQDGHRPEIHPEQFLGRSNRPKAGWVICNSDLGRILCKKYEHNYEQRIEGQVVALQDVKSKRNEPCLISRPKKKPAA